MRLLAYLAICLSVLGPQLTCSLDFHGQETTVLYIGDFHFALAFDIIVGGLSTGARDNSVKHFVQVVLMLAARMGDSRGLCC